MSGTDIIKTISIKRQWVNLIICGAKTIETRTWSTSHRGRLGIASSRDGNEPGMLMAICNLIDCHPMIVEDEKEACCKIYPGAYSWILSDIQIIKAIRVRGQLGIYEVSIEN